MIVTYFQADGTTYFFSNGRRSVWIPVELLEQFEALLLKRNLFVMRQWMAS